MSITRTLATLAALCAAPAAVLAGHADQHGGATGPTTRASAPLSKELKLSQLDYPCAPSAGTRENNGARAR